MCISQEQSSRTSEESRTSAYSHPDTHTTDIETTSTEYMMAGTQKAVFVKEIGKPVEPGSREIPSPKEGEVLVKVTATMRESNHYVLISMQTKVGCNNHSPSP